MAIDVTIEMHGEGVTASIEFNQPYFIKPTSLWPDAYDIWAGMNKPNHHAFYFLMNDLINGTCRSFKLQVKRRCGIPEFVWQWITAALSHSDMNIVLKCTGTRMANQVRELIKESSYMTLIKFGMVDEGTKIVCVPYKSSVDIVIGGRIDALDEPQSPGWSHYDGQGEGDLPRWKQW